MFGLPIPAALAKPIAMALLALAILLVGRSWGQHGVYKEWIEANAQAAGAAVKITAKQGDITVKTVTEYRDRIKVLEGATTTIEKEVTRYVESQPIATACLLDPEWVRLHNAAATGTVPEATGRPDAEAGTVAAPEALKTVTENYAASLRTSARLEALQNWVDQQYRLTQ